MSCIWHTVRVCVAKSLADIKRPHPLGHGVGAATHVSACLVRARRAAPTQRQRVPPLFEAYGHDTSRCPHVAWCEGMSRRKHANPQRAGVVINPSIGSRAGGVSFRLLFSSASLFSFSFAGLFSFSVAGLFSGFPGESLTSTSTSPSSSHMSHIRV